MTTEELAAIRARDAACAHLNDNPECVHAEADRRALLAEVDRLTADFAMFKRDVWRTGIPEAKAAERARIRAAVEGLPTSGRGSISWDKAGTLSIDGDMTEEYVDRAAVLAAIDGEPR